MSAEIDIPKILKINFQKGYRMLPVVHQKPTRLQIMNECEWNNVVTFYDKCKGKVKIRKPEILVIEKIFAKHNLNPWTGEYLT